MSLEDQLVYWDFPESLRLWKYQLKEEEDFFREVFMAVKSFVVVAGASFIGPKSATPLASCPHGRQWLFPFSITAFRSRFLI